jgi:large exoprotein involved in heme utilization and adhesion
MAKVGILTSQAMQEFLWQIALSLTVLTISLAQARGGEINITAGSLFVTDGTRLIISIFGQGDAGSVNINARDTVSFDGSSVYSTVERGAVGNGGNINIRATSLSLGNGAQLNTSTWGHGDAGSVNIIARDTVSFYGISSNGLQSVAFSTVEPGAVGNGGDINIKTGSLF